ncbi:MAG TPA: MBL fold metallo-hydrolase [Dehalococcoidia bacterium]|nr:MBL fold metallo-hydrolase [Dehalococcoidia bacterium]
MEIAPDVHAVPIGQPKLMHPGGTNVYLVGRRDLTLIDTYENRKRSPGRILRYLKHLGDGARVTQIVMTHKHHDHIGGAVSIQGVTQARLLANAGTAEELERAFGAADIQVLPDGALIQSDTLAVQAIHTPGHSSDHTCYYLPDHRLLFSGDTILGIGTTTIESLADYMRSLARLRTFAIDRILPGHGPPMDDAQAKIQEYLDHRAMRERQALEVLEAGPLPLPEMTRRIYVGIPPRLHWAARRNLGHHVEKLIGEGKITSFVKRSRTYYQLA